MLVKRLDIQGFKSFAERVVVEFGPGITGIVGPNGAGKSNITDALRWVLGEQNPRLLRSSRMEDVIFNGSSTRRPLGFAEVVLTLDNSDGAFPVEYTEVAVTRRLYRSGESEYLLNGTPSRLKDIQDLLAGTGFGREGYSIIGQGRFDEVLMASPESRRGLFDEACGIGVHRGRKREALSRLDDVASRLDRVQDVVSELERQLQPLEAQADTARTFVAYRDELERLELWLEGQAVARLAARARSARARLAEMRQKVADLTERVSRLEEEIRTARTAQEELGELVERRQQEVALSEAAMRELASRIRSLEAAAADKARETQLIREELGRLVEQRTRLGERRAELGKAGEARSSRLETLRLELAGADQARAAAAKRLEDLRRVVEEAKSELVEVAGQAAAARYELSSAEGEVSRLKAERERLAREAAAADKELEDASRETAALAERVNRSGPLAEECHRSLEDLERREADLGRRLGELARKVEAERREMVEREKERLSLEAAIAAESAWSRSALAAVAAARDQGSSGSGRVQAKGLLGVLGEEIEAPPGEALALETALGRHVDALVVRTEQDLREIMSFLRGEGFGPAVIIPLDLVTRQLERRRAAGPGGRGVGVSLAALVSGPPEFKAVAEFLLGETVLAGSFDEAAAAVGDGRVRQAVTRDGILVRPGGVVTLGRGRAGSAGRGPEAPGGGESLARLRRLRELRAEVDTVRKDLAALEAERVAAEEALGEVRRERSRLTTRYQQLVVEKASLEHEYEAKRRREASLRDKVASGELELPDLGQRVLALEARAAAAAERGREASRREVELKAALSRKNEELRASDAEQSQAAAKCGELRVALATLEEQDRLAKAEAARLADDEARLASHEAGLEGRLARLAEEREKALAEVGPLRARLAATTQGPRAAGEDLETWRKRRKEISAVLDEKQAALDRLRSELADAADRERREETRLARVEAEEEMVRRRLRRDYGDDWEEKARAVEPPKGAVTLADPATGGEDSAGLAAGRAGGLGSAGGSDLAGEEEPPEGAGPPAGEVTIQARVEELRKKLSGLGVVNIGAIEEHRRLQERITFLRDQARDLTEARESLLELISEMDETMAKRFEEGFLAVRRAFREQIPRLFGGGQGDLILSDRDNILESGIEILVEPPSKKLQSLALLSTGERALSALGLLLAFLEVRPAPFVVLDEIDAPLDDANVARFCLSVATLAKKSPVQFAIVTHNKTTMEISEALYGATMGEDGVSRLVSVKLEDREELARRLEKEAG